MQDFIYTIYIIFRILIQDYISHRRRIEQPSSTGLGGGDYMKFPEQRLRNNYTVEFLDDADGEGDDDNDDNDDVDNSSNDDSNNSDE